VVCSRVDHWAAYSIHSESGFAMLSLKGEVVKEMEWGGAPACTCKLPLW
jgi:hypothetical protein